MTVNNRTIFSLLTMTAMLHLESGCSLLRIHMPLLRDLSLVPQLLIFKLLS